MRLRNTLVRILATSFGIGPCTVEEQTLRMELLAELNVYPNVEKLAVEMFVSYCAIRGMNPLDWATLEPEKLEAWRAAASTALESNK